MIPICGTSGSAPDAARRSERRTILLVLAAVTGAAWVYLLLGGDIAPDEMDMGGGGIMLMMPAWTPAHAALMLIMWVVMMAAMMLPGATPAVLAVAASRAPVPVSAWGAIVLALCFAGGYLAVWAAFGVVATAAQWALDAGHLLTESMTIASAHVAGGLLAAIGIFQVTPLKRGFLEHCRNSAACRAPEQRPSAHAMAERGLRYGIACAGCCAPLMCLLFVGGIMNVLWLAAISLWVLAEKTLPMGSRIARLGGIALLLWAAVLVTLS